MSQETNSRFQMIDVGQKKITHRIASAKGCIQVGDEVFSLIQKKALPKGDVLAMAECAGIVAAKKTPDMLPLCHPLPLDQVQIKFEPNPATHSITAMCTVSAMAKTGVEMEALAGVQVALLTIYDLVKGVNPELVISDIHLMKKEGGKKGVWIHPRHRDSDISDAIEQKKSLLGVNAAVVTISDRASTGQREDISGPLVGSQLEQSGATVLEKRCISDDLPRIIETLLDISNNDSVSLILTTGGTGIGPRDCTPEAIEKVCDIIIPGIGETLRQQGALFTNMSWLSRSVAGICQKTLIVTLPGNPKAVIEGLTVLEMILPHALSIIEGADHG